ncbi:hypothetical protein MESS2_600019 [Mesorhizobium metallidurans STM 2683]|uniref:Uncharacterized protein n=1 Tax=Mesorhizobium metallidurans STM 2683 TaxID=1297569 RepID=M5EUG5_9HYPH|nr:hypothetical protein [Mesorhizobium metallidurans]CCV07563.1 hypothetical protein MESS2_600019 [Mesorhizobium metallidurans STM 2683]
MPDAVVHNENAASVGPKRRGDQIRSSSTSAAYELVKSGDEAEARRIHGTGLAGHGVGKALALERGGQVHFTAGEEAGKKLHCHLHSVAQTGRLRLMEWGSSFAGADIGLREGKLNDKSEALDMKSDAECDKFGQSAQIFDYLQSVSSKSELLCGLLMRAMQRRHGS